MSGQGSAIGNERKPNAEGFGIRRRLLGSSVRRVGSILDWTPATGGAARFDKLKVRRDTQMFNDEDLLRFTTWIVVQPEYENSGFVASANDHGSKTKTVLWAGPQTSLLDRIVGEADARGIGLTVQHVKYSRANLRQGSMVIFTAAASLLEAGFHLSGIEGTDPSHDGLIVRGFAPRSAAGGEQLDERLVDAVRVVLSRIPDLRSAIALADVQIAHGKIFSSRPSDRSRIAQ
ncbi:MAG: hypothetical protein M3Y49_04570 [Actinomycetota bacterium]|nr:hypothetical protein [Actinomycetota bacterium]